MKSIKRTLNLYLPFAKAGIKIELSYKAQIVMWIVISFVEVFFVLFLYEAIYRNSPGGMSSVINGFTYNDMVLYMITSFLCDLHHNRVSLPRFPWDCKAHNK